MYQEVAYRPTTQNNAQRHSSQVLKSELDQIIHRDLQVLRESKISSGEHLLVRQSNDLMLNYVKQLYHEYSIEDPLSEEVHLSRLTSQPDVHRTIKKQKIQMTSNHTLRYSISMRNKTIEDQENPIPCSDQEDGLGNKSQFRRQFYNNSTIIQASERHLNPDSSYRAKNYSLTDLLNNLDDSHRQGKKNKNSFELAIEEETPFTFDEQVENQGLRLPSMQGKIPEMFQVQQTYRYCVGCQSPILHANIKSHESICYEFIEMSKMSHRQMVALLRKKVFLMKERIHEQSRSLHYGDVDQFKQSSLQLINQGLSAAQSTISSTKFEESYRNAIGVGRKWCLISQMGSKIKWFAKVIENMNKFIES